MPPKTTPELTALQAQCNREAVHAPGAIQPAGCLLSLDHELAVIVQISANIEQVLGISVSQALQATPSQLLGARLINRLRQELQQRERLPGTLTIHRQINGCRCRFRLIAYRHRQRVLIELERVGGMTEQRLLPAVNEWLTRIAGAETEDTLLQLLVEAVRSLTGHDRVMVYRFDADWHGTVVAESRSEQASGYLGHSFPASDIPPQVRGLYLINPVRSIPDATVAAVPLVPAVDPEYPEPLDLSPGVLRAVSPRHLDYMCNMGVQAALSVAIQGDSGLWGLLACHGLAPTSLSPLVRDAVYTLVQMTTQRLFLLKSRDETAYLRRVQECRELLGEAQTGFQEPGELLQHRSKEWLDVFNAGGVALIHNGRICSSGQVPSKDELSRVGAWLNAHHQGSGVWCSQHLASTPLSDVCGRPEYAGLLAVPLPVDAKQRDWLLLFRAERLKSYRWAGRLEAMSQMEDGQRILSPQRSFETWVEEVHEQSDPWLPREQRAALDIGEDVTVAILVKAISDLNNRLTQVNRRLEGIATTDALTRVWNRYRIEQAIETDIGLAVRLGQPLALLMLDVDFFKRINDRHGHETGDAVLATLAEVITRTLRDNDCLGRWGGEEFVILASGCGLDDGKALAERIRQAVGATDFGAAGRVTISLGVSQWRPGDDRKSLVERADTAMYAAKQTGRNRVMTEDDQGSIP
ncbi:sensor domain-containing diguanylate cyclase [uncultured Oceanisphaera sp.]|uniref:sensor domain-containing diguanylate cyclase n=1 Tax=uncultured Oceanisphaera sp. TaxID=353858 RepID=UPI002620518B|nr:sensor domain-containing diguanylate cyclase [uncultured Oceanisphaera sp.]